MRAAMAVRYSDLAIFGTRHKPRKRLQMRLANMIEFQRSSPLIPSVDAYQCCAAKVVNHVRLHSSVFSIGCGCKEQPPFNAMISAV